MFKDRRDRIYQEDIQYCRNNPIKITIQMVVMIILSCIILMLGFDSSDSLLEYIFVVIYYGIVLYTIIYILRLFTRSINDKIKTEEAT